MNTAATTATTLGDPGSYTRRYATPARTFPKTTTLGDPGSRGRRYTAPKSTTLDDPGSPARRY